MKSKTVRAISALLIAGFSYRAFADLTKGHKNGSAGQSEQNI